MVQLRIVSGRERGSVHHIRQFPAVIGRSHSSAVVLEENGVWDQHAELALIPADGFHLKTFPNALVSVNGQPADQVRLRNGDLIEIGSVRLQFCLTEILQRDLRLRETLTWIGLALTCAGQIVLIYWLTR